MKNNVTDYRFKVLYFIGIIFVVAGHINNGGVSLFYDWFPVYSFHLGLFVFCSGYLYNCENENNVGKYILRKIKKLLIPLYLYNLFYALLVLFLSIFDFKIGYGGNILYKIFIMPIYHGHQFMYNLGGWFVIPLFLIEVFNIIIRKIFNKLFKKKYKEIVLFIIYLLLGLLGVFLSIKEYNYGYFLIITRTLYFMPFLGLGILYRNKLEKYDKLSNFWYFFIIFTIALIIISIYGYMPYYIVAWCNNFNEGIFVPFIVGFLGIAFWFRLATIMTPIIGKSKIINIVADHSYSIMINQFLGFMAVKGIFGLVCKYTKFCHNFDFNLFKTDIWYVYLPKNIEQFRIIYLLFGIFVPIIISDFFKYLSSKIFKKNQYHNV